MDSTALATTTGGALVDSIDINAVAATMAKVNTFQAIIQKNLMEGRDYGKVPGTDKPTLLKSGAEKVNMIFGLYPSYEFMRSTADFDHGFFDYEIRCTLYRKGEPVAQGVGSCNSREKKYRYVTKSEQQLAEAGIDINSANGFTDRYGRTKYRVEDPDIADKANTILKMAKKRAYVDATLQVTSLSDLFTQDLEDYDRSFVAESTETMLVKEALKLKITFGNKHKGQTLKEIWDTDRGYLEWLLNGEKTDPTLRKAIQLMMDYVNGKNAKAETIAAQEAQAEPEQAPIPDDPDTSYREPPEQPMVPESDYPEFLKEDNTNA